MKRKILLNTDVQRKYFAQEKISSHLCVFERQNVLSTSYWDFLQYYVRNKNFHLKLLQIGKRLLQELLSTHFELMV